MLYSIAQAAKSTGLEESLFLKAIEDGKITGTKNVSGEWHVEDAELHSLYLSIAQDNCKRQWQADLRRSDGRSQQAEIANIADSDEGRGGQEHHTAADQAENSPSPPSTASIWQDGIRIDNRERISASDSRPAFRPTRMRFVTATVLLALGCSGALSSFYFFGPSQVPEQNANSSGPVLGSEKASITVTTLEPRSGKEIIGNLASATANAFDHPHESAKTLSQASSPPPAVTEQDSHTAAKKGQAKALRKLVPVSETGPHYNQGLDGAECCQWHCHLGRPPGHMESGAWGHLARTGKGRFRRVVGQPLDRGD